MREGGASMYVVYVLKGKSKSKECPCTRVTAGASAGVRDERLCVCSSLLALMLVKPRGVGAKWGRKSGRCG